MNQRPFHAVRWVTSQIFIISLALGGFLSAVYFFFLLVFWLIEVTQ